ncbi:NADH:ubiquinone oxidoreductase subunit N [Fictibacillus phosphorivorans]|uniref:NADH-quinone oxidoreductase subunit N n=1 Tax=Fictibacillus phosphorivorans TaxID=1221500 RepID=A0A165MYM8_9BACL|nr:NADH-quinone oxidoreductase subunit NuoN [Fictibacillus phosphorivorans]KZE63940.1 NADH:ubiquinone oxidoreductase subunit N [Fictibacillus phosphorivorans]
MDLDTLFSFEWGVMSPEFIILGTATLLSIIDLFMKRESSRKPLAWLAGAGVLASLVAIFMQLDQDVTSILYDTYRLDSFSKAFKILLLLGTLLVLVLASNYKKEDVEENRGEFYYLLLAALLGAMVMASSADLITLFVGLELLSLSSYIMAGLERKNKRSNESAFKYVVSGGIATAITLFGMSYIFGLTGETNLFRIAENMGNVELLKHSFLIVFAFIITFAGLTFKIAAAPLHMWAPDVYEGAPVPVTAFLSVVSKTAGFVILLRVIIITFIAAPGIGSEPLLLQVQPYVMILAAATMIIGNVTALRQRNIKRMFAYSSIAQAGYILVPFVSNSSLLFELIWFYLLAYLFMNIGAFTVIQLLTSQEGSNDIGVFRGLFKRSPWLAVPMTFFVLSLAGIPVTAGFIGKFGIFMGALGLEPAHYWLAAVMMATTLVSYVYYFNIIAIMFFRDGDSEGKRVSVPGSMAAVLAFCAASVLILGIMPDLALDFFYGNFDVNEFFMQIETEVHTHDH